MGTHESFSIVEAGIVSDQQWSGAVSAAALLESGKSSETVLREAARRLDEFYVRVTSTAPLRCIDGRFDPAQDETNLGPQEPGGTPGDAIAYKLGVDPDAKGDIFVDDAKAMMDRIARLGGKPGGHRDNHLHENGGTGCGAVDRMDEALKIMTLPEKATEHQRIVAALMGDAFDPEAYSQVMDEATVLNGQADVYFASRGNSIDELAKRDEASVATLQGKHEECFVVINTVPGTTLASNRFAETFGIQAFGYDIWHTFETAEKILPRPDQAADRNRFITARIMVAVATLMVLTDGSQRLILRQPVEATTAP